MIEAWNVGSQHSFGLKLYVLLDGLWVDGHWGILNQTDCDVCRIGMKVRYKSHFQNVLFKPQLSFTVDFTDDANTSLEKLRSCLSPVTFAFEVAHWWKWQHWPELNSPRLCGSVGLSLWFPDMALQEAVGSSWKSWADPACQGGKGTWVSSCWHQKSYTCGGGFLQLCRAVCRQGRKEGGAAAGWETPGVCWSSPAAVVCPGCFTPPALGSTGCSHCWRRSLGPVCTPDCGTLSFLLLKVSEDFQPSF